MAKYIQMNLEDRCAIERGLRDCQSFKTIGETIGKDCTTVSKEVRSHLVFRKSGAYGRAFNDCALRKTCKVRGLCSKCRFKNQDRLCATCGRCCSSCISYKQEVCQKLSRPPYVCNGCLDYHSCTLEKRFYEGVIAQNEYSNVLSEARSGAALDDDEIRRLDAIVSPLLRKGQSIHHIVANHKDELMISERTLYKYVNAGLFSSRNIDMPRAVRMRPRRKRPATVKVDPECRHGRTIEDFHAFMEKNSNPPYVEMDSVEGTKGSAVLLTLTIVGTGVQQSFRREHNDAKSVTDIFNQLYKDLGRDLFMKLFPVILADNGSEFSDPKSIEFDADGNRRTYVFYCNRFASYQKGYCEVHHEMIRRVIPKGVDIAQYSQEQISMMMDCINSYSRKTLGDKTPYDVFAFIYGEDALKKLGVNKVRSDSVTLTPSLLK